MRLLLYIFLMLTSIEAKCQSSYSGYLNKNPITLIMYHYNDGNTYAYYTDNNFDTPIKITGNLKNETLTFLEKDIKGKNIATLIFDKFKESRQKIEGKWISIDSTKTYEISLKKDFDINYGSDFEWTSREVLQSNSTRNHYFKTIIDKKKGLAHGSITGVKIFEKKTDQLLQTIELDCQLLAIDNVAIGDYNFNGLEDFSVLASISVHVSNTSSIYMLKESNSNKYTVSGFKGTSLEFDSNLKLVFGKDECCEGRNEIHTTYKIINNQMVMIEEKCLKYDYENAKFIEITCK
ncbi:XAC2610-related protein [Polaribacter glomeratus]|uniref:Uncharacterized protein n=1 Tax=Polaribacter glomeratus TaxID=102 RepID=A0A2S7WIX9_9FLAO|nr:hypothetical protein [Polaribacter glomeratus]PQJ77550.1 hypothetical protein BTO16_17195 [Polaribacter glomeratus]TXD66144.1 hypothetical protein ESX12_08280 [Polaribacter glomeratus]